MVRQLDNFGQNSHIKGRLESIKTLDKYKKPAIM
jgi:hypothetical protein